MIQALTLLFICQLAGEALTHAAGLPFPGPVLGMGICFAGLLIAGRSGAGLDEVADGILKNLSLLFVPAAVGVVQQIGVISANWMAIAAALLGSTVLTLIVTVTVFQWVAQRTGQ